MRPAVRTGSRFSLIGEQTEALQFHSPVIRWIKFELIILKTQRGRSAPTLLAITDEVIE